MNNSPEETVFQAALEIQDPDKRSVCLAQACGEDRELRQAVEALLRESNPSRDFLEEPPLGPREGSEGSSDKPIDSPAEKPGDRIGRYKLLERVGEGGCGVVYMAEQEEPIRRRVALKILKLGMDTMNGGAWCTLW